VAELKKKSQQNLRFIGHFNELGNYIQPFYILTFEGTPLLVHRIRFRVLVDFHLLRCYWCTCKIK